MKLYQYFMVGTFGALTAFGAKATVQGQQQSSVKTLHEYAKDIIADFLVNLSASADVLAQAKVEIDLAAIPEGKNVREMHT